MRRVKAESYFKFFMKWLELDDRTKCATLTESQCAENSRPLSTVRNVTVVPSSPKSA